MTYFKKLYFNYETKATFEDVQVMKDTMVMYWKETTCKSVWVEPDSSRCLAFIDSTFKRILNTLRKLLIFET